MEFRVLGAVDAVVDGASVLRARRRERLLLGLLALEVGNSIGIHRLTDLLWGDAPPQDPRRTLRVYASRLRSQLAPRTAQPLIRFECDGYRLDVDPETVDAHRFRAAVSQAAETTDRTERVRLLRGALTLWRGELLADAADETLRARLRGGLEQLRTNALELRIAAELDLGRHARLIPELTELAAANPTRAAFVGSLMRALHACDRTAEALDVYQDHAVRLADAYGLDTSDELNNLYVAMLRDDPALRPSPAEDRAPSAVPAQLPPDLSTFVGRATELTALTEPDDDPAPGRSHVVAVDGMAGVGKSALVVRAAHRVADRYPDGSLYIDLHGFTAGTPPTPPADALDRLLRTIAPSLSIPQGVDSRAAAWRSLLADRRVLVILDNAADSAQVRPLLPAASGCLVYVTSRKRLSDLDDARHLTLPLLSADDSDTLFNRVTGDERIGDEGHLVGDITGLCGRLPLAVRIAAARLRDQPFWTPRLLLNRLRDNAERLSELDTGERGVASALDVSYQYLDADARRAFRLLALVPAQEIDVLTAAATADVTPRRAETLLAELVSARMLEATSADRYGFHDLVRRFAAVAANRDESDADRSAALARLVRHCAATVNACVHGLDPARMPLDDAPRAPVAIPVPNGYDEALARLEDGRRLWRDVITAAHAEGMHREVCYLCRQLTMYYELRGHLDDWRATHRLGVESAAALSDPRAQAEMQHRLAGLHGNLGDLAAARLGFEEAERAYARLGNELGRASVLNNLGAVLTSLSNDDESMRTGTARLRDAHRVYERLEDEIGMAKVLANLANAALRAENLTEARERFESALRLFRRLDRPGGEAFAQLGIARVHMALGDHEAAVPLLRQALRNANLTGGADAIRQVLTRLGEALFHSGRGRLALRYHGELARLIADDPASTESCRMRLAIGRTFAACGHPTEALEQFHSAAEVATGLGAADLVTEARDAAASVADRAVAPLSRDAAG